MTTGFAVWARKNGGPWVQTGTYTAKKTANVVCRVATQGEWVAEVRPITQPSAPSPLPTGGNADAYSVMGARIKMFFPTGEFKTNKKGETKEVLGMTFQHKVCVKCLRSGQKWEYTGHRFGWTDSRVKTGTVDMVKKEGSIPHDKFAGQLARMVGEKAYTAISAAQGGDPIKKDEWASIVKGF